MDRVFVAIGGNIGDSKQIIQRGLSEISSLEYVHDLTCSSTYQTSPVSVIPQNDYHNAVCSFFTDAEPKTLLNSLQEIEKKLGKLLKPRDAPRIIDLDIIFFGSKSYRDAE